MCCIYAVYKFINFAWSRKESTRVRSATDLSPVFLRFWVQTGLEPEQNIYQTRVQKYKKKFEYANILAKNIIKPALNAGTTDKVTRRQVGIAGKGRRGGDIIAG